MYMYMWMYMPHAGVPGVIKISPGGVKKLGLKLGLKLTLTQALPLRATYTYIHRFSIKILKNKKIKKWKIDFPIKIKKWGLPGPTVRRGRPSDPHFFNFYWKIDFPFFYFFIF